MFFEIKTLRCKSPVSKILRGATRIEIQQLSCNQYFTEIDPKKGEGDASDKLLPARSALPPVSFGIFVGQSRCCVFPQIPPLTPVRAFCTIVGTSSLFGVNPISCRVAEGRALRRHGNRTSIIYRGWSVPTLSWKQGT